MLRRGALSLAAAVVSQLWLSGPAAAQEAAPPPATPPAAEPAPATPPAATPPAAEPAPAAPPAVTPPAAEAAPPAAPAGEVVTTPPGRQERTEEIVVTGTRIRRKDLTTPAPVTVINRAQIEASGKASIGDFLQALPEQGNAINTAVNNGGDGSTRVSLRGLGPQRTLVLMNGRRLMPGGTGADASVDLNSIPTASIERIEILKDGASAVYGSDAIAGVVNLITKKNWNGTEASVYSGIAGAGDGRTVDMNVTSGTTSDKGSLTFTGGFFDQAKTMAGDRDFSKYQYFYDATGNNNAAGVVGQYAAGSSRVPGGRISTTVPAGETPNAAFTGIMSDPANAGRYLVHDSTLTAANPGVAACLASGATRPDGSALTLSDCQWRHMNTTNAQGLGGDLYNYAPFNYLLTPQRRISAALTGDTKFADVARGFFESSYVNRQSSQQLAPEPLIIGAGGLTDQSGNLVKISKDNIYNPFGLDITSASRRLDEFGFRTHEEDLDSFRVVGGLDGTLPEAAGFFRGWSWDASLNYGRTSGTFIIGGSLQTSRVADALGPSMIIGGKPACVRVAGDAATVVDGCVPLDLFHGSGTISRDQVAPLIFTGTSRGFNQMTSVQVNTGGELFSLLSDRPAALAAGYEHRLLSGGFTNDPLTAKFDSSNGGAADTKGSYIVDEGYAELTIPILSAVPYVNDLEGSAAARVFHYSNFGSDWTYKFGARYRPIRDVTVRGTYSTAFRAPSIPDLFAGRFDNFPAVSDPCATALPGSEIGNRCGIAANNGDDSVQLRATNGGNSALKPETAKIFTVGLVFEPTMVKNFSATVDYYNMTIDNTIRQVPESIILAGCFVKPGFSADYCNSTIIRDPATQRITYILNPTQNLGTETLGGIDLALRYAVPTAGFGRFGFTFDGTWLQKHDLKFPGTLIEGKDTFDLQLSSGQGGTNPAFKFNAGVAWGLGGFGAGVTTKFVSGFHECGTPDNPGEPGSGGDFSGSGLCYISTQYERHVNAYNTYDVYVAYNFGSVAGKTNVAAGVANVFDKNPSKIYNGFASATDQYNYDQIGRFFYVRLAQLY